MTSNPEHHVKKRRLPQRLERHRRDIERFRFPAVVFKSKSLAPPAAALALRLVHLFGTGERRVGL